MDKTCEKNLHYQSDAIERFYRQHRISWDQFYLSERTVLEQLGLNVSTSVLDIGCGCGGLGLALRERFGINEYTGIEINIQAARAASEMNSRGRFLAADVLELKSNEISEESYDLVASLSCIDWNIEFDRMLEKAWRYVKPGGYFLSSFRLESTASDSIEMDKSYQYINFEGQKEGEKAPYVVLNPPSLMARLNALNYSGIRGHGYWGRPSATAVTPYNRICFAVLALEKPRTNSFIPYKKIVLPTDILRAL